MVYLKPQSPLKRNKSNDYFYPITTMDQIIVDENSRLNDYSIISTREINVVLSTDNWIANSNSYSQTIKINDLNEDYNVDVKIAYTSDLEKDLLIGKSASCINYAKQDNDKITFYCLNKNPTNDIPIEIEVSV